MAMNPYAAWKQHQFQAEELNPYAAWKKKQEPQGPTFQQAEYIPEQMTQALFHPPDSRPIVEAAEPMQDLRAQAAQGQRSLGQFMTSPRQNPDMPRPLFNPDESGLTNEGAGRMWDTFNNSFLLPAWRAVEPWTTAAAHAARPVTDNLHATDFLPKNPEEDGLEYFASQHKAPETYKAPTPPTRMDQAKAEAAAYAASDEGRRAAYQGLPVQQMLEKVPGIGPTLGSFFDPARKTISEGLVGEGWNPWLAMGAELMVPGGPLELMSLGKGLAGGLEGLAKAKGGELGKALAEPMGLYRAPEEALAQERALQQAARGPSEVKPPELTEPQAAFQDLRTQNESPLSKWMQDFDNRKRWEGNNDPGLPQFADDPAVSQAAALQQGVWKPTEKPFVPEPAAPKPVDVAPPVAELPKPAPVEPPAALEPPQAKLPSAERTEPATYPIDPRTVNVDAKAYQFKSGSDSQGVTGRLGDVKRWEPLLGQTVVIHERKDGSRWIADGHQRLDLARRAIENGQQDAMLNAYILRESEGHSIEDARLAAARKNLAEGSGTALDAAKVFKANPEAIENLTKSSAVVRDGRELAKLGDAAFEEVVNGAIPESYAAHVGRLLSEPADQLAAIKALKRIGPANSAQAESIVQDIRQIGLATKSEQGGLFGDEMFKEDLLGERAKIFDAATKQIAGDKRLFSRIIEGANPLEKAGNKLAKEANVAEVDRASRIQSALEEAKFVGPIAEKLNELSRLLKSGDITRAEAARQFLASVETESQVGKLAGRDARALGGIRQAPDKTPDGGRPASESIRAVGPDGGSSEPTAPKVEPEAEYGDTFQFASPAKGNAPRGTGTQNTAPVVPAPPAPQPGPAPGPPKKTPVPPRAPGAPIGPGALSKKIKSDFQVARDLNETLGRLSRGEFNNSIMDRLGRMTKNLPGSRIVYGKVKGQGKAIGSYSPKYDLITVARAGDFDAAFHEVAHKVDNYTKVVANAPADVAKEFEKIGDPATNMPRNGGKSSWLPGEPLKKKQEEGFSEFVRLWMTEPQWVAQNAPKALEHWNQKLEEWNDIGRRLVNHQQDYQTFKNAPWQVRLRAKTVEGANPGNASTAIDLVEGIFDNRIRMKLLDDLAQQKLGRRLMPSESAYVTSSLLAGLDNKVNHWVKTGPMDWATQTPIQGKRALQDIFLDAGPMRNDLMDFEDYLLAKRADELHGRGMESGFDKTILQDAQAGFGSKKTQHFEKLAAEVYDYNDHLLKYMQDSGAYSKEQIDAIRKLNTAYVPFYRLYEKEVGIAEDAAAGTGQGLHASDPMKRIKGSQLEVYRPVQTLISNTHAMVNYAHKNAVGQTLAKMWDKGVRVGEYFHEVSPEMVKAARVGAGEVVDSFELRQELRRAGIDMSPLMDSEVKAILQALPEQNIWRQKKDLPNGWIRVRDKGEDRFFQLTPKFARTWGALDEGQIPQLAKWLSIPGNILRKGATTLSPGFLFLRNPFKDALEAAVYSKNSTVNKVLAGVTLRGMREYFNPEAWDAFTRSAGAQTFHEMIGQTPEAARVTRQQIFKKLKPSQQEMTFMEKTGFSNFLGFLWDKYERAGTAGEQSTRMGDFALSRERIARENPSWPKHEVDTQAAFEARDLMDFSRRGTSETLRIARRMIPFFGAAMNGAYKMGKEFHGTPLQTAAKAFAFLTIPSVTIAAMNYNDPDYWDLPQAERDNFWHIPTPLGQGADKFIRLPKPHELGFLFGTLPERFIQWAAKNDRKAFEGALSEGLDKTNPIGFDVFGGPLGKTFLEIASNHNFFTGKDVENRYAVSQHPAAWIRSNEYSSATAKALAKALHGTGILPGLGYRDASPIQLDHIISNLTGYGGTNFTRMFLDPVVSRATGEALPKASKRDPLGLHFREDRFESVDRFEKELDRLKAQEEAQGNQMDPKEADRLANMKQDFKVIKKRIKERQTTSDPVQRDLLNREIRKIASQYTPSPGGPPK